MFYYFYGRQRQPRVVRQTVQSLGSGFIVDPTGYIVTNQHVVERAADLKISVTTIDGKTYAARYITGDPTSDLAFIKIGAYDDTWPDIHLTPEQAVRACTLVQGKVLFPIHWGTFNLAFHRWDEPADRVVAAAQAAGVSLVMPKLGESIEPSSPPPVDPWWRTVKAR